MNLIKSLVLAGVLATAQGLATIPASAQQQGPRPMPTLDQRREDLKTFREKFMAVDKSFSPEARAAAEARLARLEAALPGVSQPYFELELARIVALADNGHTHYVLGSISRYYNRVPIRLVNFGEDFAVVRARDPNSDLLGATLVSIDGRPIGELRKAERELWGGLDAWRDKFAYNFLESPDLLNAAGLAKTASEATFVFRTPAGAIIERKLAGEPASDARPFSNGWVAMFPDRLPLEDASWHAALAPDKAPFVFTEPSKVFRWRNAPEINAVVMEMRANQDQGGARIADALKSFTDAIKAAKPANLVLDMRDNVGGNLTTSREFMKSLPSLAPGRIFVLTSPLTFSAAISSIGYLEQAAPEKVVIVGEPVGDRLMFWAEGRGADLPNSRGQIGLATQRHDYAGGCKAYSDCHFNVKLQPITVKSLAPDIAAPWTIDAYLAGRDPAMEAVAAALKSGG